MEGAGGTTRVARPITRRSPLLLTAFAPAPHSHLEGSVAERPWLRGLPEIPKLRLGTIVSERVHGDRYQGRAGRLLARSESVSEPKRPSRYLTELGIIVAGILLALAADSLWNSRQDGQRERQYLASLANELQTADSVLGLIVTQDSSSLAERAITIRALTSPDEPAPDGWADGLGVRLEEAAFGTGTIVTLVETGDINLIRSLEVKLKVGELYSVLGIHMPRVRFFEELLLQYNADYVRIIVEAREAVSLEDLRANTALITTMLNTQTAARLRVELHREIRLRVAGLLGAVRSELEATG